MWRLRTELLLKKQGLQKLEKAHVLIVGLGGVGSFASEFLARSGVGHLTLVDGDKVEVTNINRQLPALHSTIGKAKIKVIAERLKDINPAIELHLVNRFIEPDKFTDLLNTSNYDYVIDAIDSVSPKIYLILAAKQKKIKIVSALGAGGKIDP